ncbi:alpha/beta hydrolase family esterase [Sorangium sp. So ce117]|uniref:alpha/beta hydrolase family esterase n=1 Tax=Sorangium sp. So ce117 TaxID=3133277 RepID=UPI003F614FF7
MKYQLRDGVVSAIALAALIGGCAAACSGSDGASSGDGEAGGGGSTSGGTSGAEGGSGSQSSGGSNGSSGGSGGSGPATGAGGGDPSDGCATPGQATEGYRSIEVGGTTRRYYLVPATTTTTPAPLVISFHGHSGTGQGDVSTFALRDTTGGQAVLMFPDGVPQDWYGDAVGWDNRSTTSPDVAFTKALIDEAAASHCIDRSRVFLVGFSWGGWMSAQAGCALGDQVRALVSAAGGPPAGNCAGPVSALIVHGAADDAEPLDSGIQTRDRFVALNQCGSGTSPAGSGSCVAYEGCTKPTWWWQHELGHTLPEDSQRTIWEFLLAAP